MMTILTAVTCAGNAAVIPHLHMGDTLSNVVVFTTAVRAPGYAEAVTRAGGTMSFIVTSTRSDSIAFDLLYRYDGDPAGRTSVILRDGRRTRCIGGTCSLYSDASGVLYNPYLWGDAPRDLCDGATWTVALPEPWGMGPRGSQTVHVIRVDAAAHMVMLRRDGAGQGAFAHDDGHVTLTKDSVSTTFNVAAGAAHWSGYTIMRDGAVIADELFIERSLVLTAPGHAPIRATERQYVVYNTIVPLRDDG